ncbi:MAG: DNA-directed RNA polymerase subunit omega [Peptoniphilus lacrimalis]
MNIPSFKELMEKSDSRYELCMLVSKRSRKLVDGQKALVDTDMKKPVSVALEEVMEGKIIFGQEMSDKEYEEKIAVERLELEEKLINEIKDSPQEEE